MSHDSSPSTSFPSFEIVARYLGALDPSAPGEHGDFAWQTTDDRKEGNAHLIDTPHGSLTDHYAHLARLNTSTPGAGVHVCIHQTDGGGRTEEHIVAPRTVVLDFDEGGPPEGVGALPVSMVVESARGPHLYWLLAPGEDLHQWRRVQIAMARKFGADVHASKLTQTMRVPGFFHNKGDRAKVWIRICEPHRRYTLGQLVKGFELGDELNAILAEEAENERRRASAKPPVRALSDYDRIGRARAYLQHVGGAGEGNRNEFTARQVVPVGWRFGIHEDDWLAEVYRWNDSNNSPPLPVREIRSIVRSMYRKLQRTGAPFGSALDEDTTAYKQRQEERQRRRAQYDEENEARWAATLADDLAVDPLVPDANISTPRPDSADSHVAAEAQVHGPDPVPPPRPRPEPTPSPALSLKDFRDFRYGTPVMPDGHPLTTRGNAARFLDACGDIVRFCPQLDVWYVWTGSHWRKDERVAVDNLAQQVLAGIHHLFAHPTVQFSKVDTDRERARKIETVKQITAHLKASECPRGIQNLLGYARSQRSVYVGPTDLDRDDLLVNTESGVVDVRTLEVRSHDASLLQSRITRVPYVPKARSDLWNNFVDWAMQGDQDMVRFLQRAAGVSFTGSCEDEVFFVCFGIGGNGKSTFIETLLQIASGYGRTCDFSMFLQDPRGRAGSQPNEELLALKDARIIYASEPDQGARLNESLIKRITGGERVTARPLYGKPIEFYPKFTLWLSTNHKPSIRGTDDGIWRRVVLIPWEACITPQAKDPHLKHKLARPDELQGILRWVMEGANAWHKDGLQIPERVRAATSNYREDMDSLGEFLHQRCLVERGSGYRVRSSYLYDEYRKWCDGAGERPFNQKNFTQLLLERGFRKARSGSRGQVEFQGIALRATPGQEAAEDDGAYEREERLAIQELENGPAQRGLYDD